MNLHYDFFSVGKKDIVPRKGKVLVSEPFLSDQYFKRSIVLLAEYNEEGTLGFVLNKPIDAEISDLVKDFPDKEIPASLGGPVATNTLHYIHTLGDILPESKRIYKNIYWGGNFEVLKNLIGFGSIDIRQVRFFVGYSGWEPGQLERELSENSWVITELSPEQIMSTNDPMIWKNVLRMMGRKYRLWADFPENPGLN